MNQPPTLTALSEEERAQALARFRLLQPYFEGQATLRAVAQAQDIPLRTATRWATCYRQQGLAGLVRQARRPRATPPPTGTATLD